MRDRQRLTQPRFTIVTTPRQLAEAVEALRRVPIVALDTEGNSRHHYPDRVSLVQAAAGEEVFVIDPLAVTDLRPLGQALADSHVQKVLHGADYDLRGLNREWGLVCENLYDTNIAARFAGLERVGLAALLEDVMQVRIPKEEKIQRTDWSRRPLSDAELIYASEDVVHLVALRDALDARVRALGRQEWVAEECERLTEVRYAAPDAEWAFLGVKDSRRLDARGLAVLKSLHAMRDAEARRRDRPPEFVLPGSALLHIARYPNADLATTPELSPGALRRYEESIRRAVREGVAAEPIVRQLQASRVRPAPDELERHRRLKEWRASLGRELSLDPSLLWPMRSLERLAREPGALESELDSPDVRRWQRSVFGERLRAAVAGL